MSLSSFIKCLSYVTKSSIFLNFNEFVKDRVSVFVRACVCVQDGVGEREKERDRERDRERERDGEFPFAQISCIHLKTKRTRN